MTAFTKAKRLSVPLLIGVAGGTGSGKTFSALRLASGIANGEPFHVIDTENRRALHYADDFDFLHAELKKPFRPSAYMDAIGEAESAGAKVIVVDSASHEWAGDGGCLDWHDELMGNDQKKNVQAWIRPKREHKKWVNQLLSTRAHIILCFRAEPKVDIVTKNGQMQIVPKVAAQKALDGWLPISEKMLPYELTASFLLMADAPGVPKPIKLMNKLRDYVPLDRPISEEVGVALAMWAAGPGADPPFVPNEGAAEGLSLDELTSTVREEALGEAIGAVAQRLHPGKTAADLTDRERWLVLQETRKVIANG